MPGLVARVYSLGGERDEHVLSNLEAVAANARQKDLFRCSRIGRALKNDQHVLMQHARDAIRCVQDVGYVRVFRLSQRRRNTHGDTVDVLEN